MANRYPIVFPIQLLAKAIIRFGRTYSIDTVTAMNTMQDAWTKYVLTVLKSNANVRAGVFDLVKTSNSPAQQQLTCILAMFELLSAQDKKDFIDAYKSTATLAGQGLESVTHDSGWDPDHIPPQNEP